ncbi:MAG: UvrD-helicase domain-containing protein [archaeon]|nr:UvrD-helicase domain-containing protein [archaeon]
MTYLDGLNAEQERAVMATEGHVRVIAGAGSGKTKALTSRYCFLISELGISPGSILCATFTNRAADEMHVRIRRELGDMDMGFICTFHGFCVQFLKEEINALNYPKEFIMWDVDDVKSILTNIIDAMGLNSKDITVKKAYHEIIERRKLKTANYIDDIYLLNNEELRSKFLLCNDIRDGIFLRYLYEQKKAYSCDFNDLINFTSYILENFPDVRKKWQERIQYVMVDEFQDVSPRQYEIALHLSGLHNNLFIVGDPDQNIYSWRGSDVNMMLDFDKRFPDANTIVLDTNYRSTPEILRASDALISKNGNRYPKTLRSVKGDGVKPLFFHGKDEDEEAEWVGSRIIEQMEDGASLNDFAVLFRAHFLSRTLEEKFIDKEIPYAIYSGTEFYSRAEIKDLICYLRMLVFADDLSLRRTVSVPPRRIGKKRLEFLDKYSEANDISLYEALKHNMSNDMFRNTGAAEYVQCIEHARSVRKDRSLPDLLQMIMDTTGYEKYMRLQGDQERLDNMSELKRSILTYSEDPDATLEDFLARVALFTNADKKNVKDKVRMMTIHAAKGMEFRQVFIIGLDEDLFPSSKVDTLEGLEEERRLMYVAMTRAKERLYLTDSEGVANGNYKWPSRFIFDIGRENLDYVVELNDEFVKDALDRMRVFEPLQIRRSDRFQVGDRVKSKVLGEGTVLEVDEKKRFYRIRFDALDTDRSIMFSAKIEKV